MKTFTPEKRGKILRTIQYGRLAGVVGAKGAKRLMQQRDSHMEAPRARAIEQIMINQQPQGAAKGAAGSSHKPVSQRAKDARQQTPKPKA